MMNYTYGNAQDKRKQQTNKREKVPMKFDRE